MSKLKIAVACQGGGSQTAFTAGALKALSHAQLGHNFEVVGISGTSGGAVCAALMWYAYLKGEQPVWGRLMRFWEENTAQGATEEAINRFIVESTRLVNSGLWPTLHFSPSSPAFQMATQFMMGGQRKGFSDFRALLEEHIDFAEIARWGPRKHTPTLVIGAANVVTGALEKFSSNRLAITADHILASCAVPSIFPAVQIGADAYWDGLFSDNPPIEELVRPRTMGEQNLPGEIWLIKINPTGRARIPVKPGEILDRRNQLEGNISLFQQLGHLEFINELIMADSFRPEFLERYHIKQPIRIPKSFAGDPDRPYHIPSIEMPQDVQDKLDFEGKIDRGAENIGFLIAEGEKAALEFLRKRKEMVSAPELEKHATPHPQAKGMPDAAG